MIYDQDAWSMQGHSHEIVYAKQLFDYFVHQEQLCKTEAVIQIAGEMGISNLNMIYHWLNSDMA